MPTDLLFFEPALGMLNCSDRFSFCCVVVVVVVVLFLFSEIYGMAECLKD